MAVCICNPNTWEAEAALPVQDEPRLHKFKVTK